MFNFYQRLSYFGMWNIGSLHGYHLGVVFLMMHEILIDVFNTSWGFLVFFVSQVLGSHYVACALWYLFLFQELLEKSNATDASGNVVLGDIGVHIQQKVCILIYSSFKLNVR